MAEFYLGDTLIISGTIKNTAGALVDPTTSTVLTVVDPAGTKQATTATMTQDGTGLYHYDYTLTTGGPTGTWVAWIIATDGTRGSVARQEISVLAGP